MYDTIEVRFSTHIIQGIYLLYIHVLNIIRIDTPDRSKSRKGVPTFIEEVADKIKKRTLISYFYLNFYLKQEC